MKIADKILVFIAFAGLIASPLCIHQVPPSNVLINEVMFNPFGDDAGNEWVELFNGEEVSQNVKGWSISNCRGFTVAELPAWDMPGNAYLVVFFGSGTDDKDFSDGSGTYYTGTEEAVFDNTEDEIAVYAGSPSSRTIVDFISWCADSDYNPGKAHDYAKKKEIWNSHACFDTSLAAGLHFVSSGESIGRSKRSEDTDSPDDWDDHGGTDAYESTPGDKNAAIYGIRFTQLKANILLEKNNFEIVSASHTILEESESDSGIFVKATHNFVVEFDGIAVRTADESGKLTSESERTRVNYSGIGKYQWKKIDSATWREEVDLTLEAVGYTAYSMNFYRETTYAGLDISIHEYVDGSITLLDYTESFYEESHTTVSQIGPDTVAAETAFESSERGVSRSIKSTAKEVMHSDTQSECWADSTITYPDFGEKLTLSVHCLKNFNAEGEVEIVFDVYDLIGENSISNISSKLSLKEQGFFKIKKTSENHDYEISWNIPLTDGESEFVLNGSGSSEVIIDGKEVIYKGYITENLTGDVKQFYVDGTLAEIVGAGIIGTIGGFLVGGPIGAAIGGLLGITGACIKNLVEGAIDWIGEETCWGGDKDPPEIKSWTQTYMGCDEKSGWTAFKFTIYDKSGTLSCTGEIAEVPGVHISKDGAYIHNTNCEEKAVLIKWTIVDNSKSKNTLVQDVTAVVQGKCPCEPDLAIKKITWTKKNAEDQNIYPGDTVTISIDVKNQGDSNATDFRVCLWIIESIQGEKYFKKKTTSDLITILLVPGQSTLVEFTYVFSSTGTYILEATVDPDKIVKESDETNNTTESNPITVQEFPMPDLQILPKDISIQKENGGTIYSGDKVTVLVRVENIGGKDAGKFKVEIGINGFTYETEVTAPVGAHVDVFFDYTFPSSGTYTVSVTLNSDEAVEESDYTNNSAEREIYVDEPPMPDLFIGLITNALPGDFIGLPPSIYAGEPTSIYVTVGNQGMGEAKNFRVSLQFLGYIQKSNFITLGPRDPEMGYSFATLTFTCVFLEPGTYKVMATADSEFNVEESNELNNWGQTEFTVISKPLLHLRSPAKSYHSYKSTGGMMELYLNNMSFTSKNPINICFGNISMNYGRKR